MCGLGAVGSTGWVRVGAVGLTGAVPPMHGGKGGSTNTSPVALCAAVPHRKSLKRRGWDLEVEATAAPQWLKEHARVPSAPRTM